MSPLHEILSSRLAAHLDPAYRKTLLALVPTGWIVRGVRVPHLRAIAREVHRAHRNVPVADVVALVDDAFATHVREDVCVGLFWLAHRKRSFPPELWQSVDRWLDEVADWEICDQLATGIATEVVARDLGKMEALMACTASANPWRRRFPMAVAAALNQKGRAHVDEALQLCLPLLDDPAPIVRKAVGWALREASKHDPEAIFTFLMHHRAATHRSILREGAKKLPAEMQRLIREEG